MKQITLTNNLFHGALSIERTDEYVKPIRIPLEQAHLFVPDRINGKADMPAGVRLSFLTNTQSLVLNVIPPTKNIEIDCLVNGTLIETGLIRAGQSSLTFNLNLEKNHLVELYLSQKVPVKISALWIDETANWEESTQSPRLSWLTYGSSITQCIEAESPSQTWPAIVARDLNLDLTCLGFDGNCQLEPMVAKMIRDTPMDFISLCIGINIYGHASLSERTFTPAVIGFIETIREKQPTVPIVLISPIYHKSGESTPNNAGMTLESMRQALKRTVDILADDHNLYYLNGLDIFGPCHEKYLHDGLHPNAEGYKVFAQQFQKQIQDLMPKFFNIYC